MGELEILMPLLAALACATLVDGRQASARSASVCLCLLGYCMVDMEMAEFALGCTAAGLGLAAVAMHAKLGWLRERVGRR